MRLFSRKSGSLLGVDIGSTAVKLVELSHGASPCRLDAWAVEPLPEGAATAETIGDAKAVGESVRRAAKRAGCRARRAAFAVPGAVAVTKTIAIDASLADREMEAEVALEADRHLPLAAADRALDFEPLHLSASDPSQAEVLLAACRAERVEGRRRAVESAGLTPVAADIETFCQQRAVRLAASAEQAVVAVADIGATATTLSVSNRDVVVFTRGAPFDGTRLHGADHISQAARQDWLQVVARLLRLYAATASNVAIPQLHLAGGGATAPGLAPSATQHLELPTVAANPFASIAILPATAAVGAADAPSLVTACGLAMRDFHQAA